MRSWNYRIASTLAVAALAALGAPSTSWAGQAGTNDTTLIATTDDTQMATSLVVGGIVITDDSLKALTNDTQNGLDSSAVVLSLEVYDDGYHGNSPSNNIASFADVVTNDAGVGQSALVTGITSVQQNAGIGNVTVQSTTLVDLTGFGVMLGNNGGGLDPATVTMVLSPAFTLSNSALAARAVAIAALQGADGGLSSPLGTVGPTAIKFSSGAVYELSPENNVAEFQAAIGNVTLVDQTAGITTVQQNVGISNVQSSFNNILFTTGDTAPIPFIGQ